MSTHTIHNVFPWAKTALPGERIVYATRKAVGNAPFPGSALESAWKAHDAGLVFLAQRSNGAGGYEYEATRVSPQVARFLGIHSDRKPWERGA